ncbi:MAG: helix-turn-helix domain-containing protein [Ekhidna sp.]|nr:helix-turn-helix domain-containing protein [Ekhidna sp.]
METKTFINIPADTFKKLESDLEEIKSLVKSRIETTQKSHYTTIEVKDQLGIGATKLHQLMSTGQLVKIKKGRRVYITRESIQRYLASSE